MKNDLEKRKKNFIDLLRGAIYLIINSDFVSENEIGGAVDAVRGLKSIISKQKGAKEKLKKLNELQALLRVYKKDKKGRLINLWNELEKII